MIKQAAKIIKQYFAFSRHERKGIIFLLILLLLVIAYPFVFSAIFPNQKPNIHITEFPETSYEFHEGNNDFTETKTEIKLQDFDPNTADDNTLRELGFSERNIQSLHKYLSKGGKFRKPEDILKLYGLSEEHKQKLLPYVVIAQQEPKKFASDTTAKNKKVQTIVELNTADSTALEALYGISGKMAARIIKERELLGGYVKLEQLIDLWGFNPDILYDLKDKLTLDASHAHIFNLNSVTEEELKTHPYFKYRLSQAIVNYRKQHGNYKQLEDLKKIVLVNDSIYNRIILYLKIE